MIKVLAILVLYKRGYQQSNSYISLANQNNAPDWFIVDNSPTPQEFPENSKYLHWPENRGVSTAYKEGANWAKINGYTHILLLDQDTQFIANAWQVYLDAVIQQPSYKIYGPKLKCGDKIISPGKRLLGRTFATKFIPDGEVSLNNYSPINSGLLIDLEFYQNVGGHEESIPLDFSDFAFLSKVRKFNSQLFVIPTICQHSLSSATIDSYETELARFRYYVQGYRAFLKMDGVKASLYFWALIRMLQLTLRHKKVGFFVVLFLKKP